MIRARKTILWTSLILLLTSGLAVQAGAGESSSAQAAFDKLQTLAGNRFLAALHEKRGQAVIAEIKMGSPSLGSLAQRFEPLRVARLGRPPLIFPR